MRKGGGLKTSCLSLSESRVCLNARVIWLLNDEIYEQSIQINNKACNSATRRINHPRCFILCTNHSIGDEVVGIPHALIRNL